MRTNDLALAKRCLDGEAAAQRELFARQLDRVHATLYRVLGANRDVEDLVQEAFVQLFRSLAVYRGDATLATWTDRVTARVAYAYLARKRPALVPLESVPEPPSGDPAADRRVMAVEAARRLYRALDRLDPRMRIAFTLHVIDGRPMDEVARTMEASLVATKTRVWRARRRIDKDARRDPVLAAFLHDGDDGQEEETS